MSSVNSAANPFLYFAFMPTFRRSVKKTLLPCVRMKVSPEDHGNSKTTSTRVSNETAAGTQAQPGGMLPVPLPSVE